MSSELAMLNLFCKSKEVKEKYYKHVSKISNLEREIKLLLNLIDSYYVKYDIENIGRDDLVAFFDYSYPSHRDRKVYIELIHSVFQTNANPEVMQDLLSQTLERHFASSIVSQLIPVMEGAKFGVLPRIKENLDTYIELVKNPGECSDLSHCTASLQDLVDTETREGYSWPLSTLASTLGPIRKQTLGIIFAYVDSGKSSFGIQCCMHILKQILEEGSSDTILYCGNEEAASRIMMRMVQCATSKTREEIIGDIAGIEKQLLQKVAWNNLKLFDNVITIEAVIKLLEQYHPSVMFLDQGTKVSTGSQMEGVQEIRELFNWYREMAKKYDCSIISLTQAVGEAENRKWLKLSDVYGSRVSMQGELDYAIGIGRIVDDPSKEFNRYFHVSKNKLHNGELCKFVSNFVKDRCYFEGI